MSFRPGTVSKILWHFTGGPQWDAKTNKQLKKLKPSKQGYEALKAIIHSEELRVGSYQEIVKIIVPQKRRYNIETKKIEIQKNVPVTIKSKPVCCVADIPLQHIAYHSNRYGKIAIGFHRKSVIKAGFNPVLYTLEDTSLINAIYNGYNAIDDVLTDEAESEVQSIQTEIDNLIEEYDIDEYVDASSISGALDFIESGQSQIEESFEHFMAYIKTFDTSEFDSIYCEREWRSTKSFKFSLEDIAIIVLPKHQSKTNYYQKFIKEMDLPRGLTIASWEDLVEH
ncbi:MAG: abortive infection system antitoxin AbiGi family protein [Pseudomonadota bacterium]|nr:abortive infection system antitoxin AbiGi family protein [Pseudomonadota bacterium]